MGHTVRYGRRQQTRQNDEVDEQSRTAPEQICPEVDCDGRVIIDDTAGERVCQECGLVVDADRIDHNAEWTAYTEEEKREKSRVGAPTTQTMHDNGLHTVIDWKAEDGNGHKLSSAKRRQMNRLRKRDRRTKAGSGQERTIKNGLVELKRLTAALDISNDDIEEVAATIYRRIIDEDMAPGRAFESLVAAALFAAVRQDSRPIEMRTIADRSRVSEDRCWNAYDYISKEFDLVVAPPDPADYVPKVASQLGVSRETEQQAQDFVGIIKEEQKVSGRDPTGIAGAAIYAASIVLNGRGVPTQNDVSEAAGVSCVTIRNRYQEILELSEYSADKIP